MKASQILREAARRIEEYYNGYGCHAINAAFGMNSHPDAKMRAYQYFVLFCPRVRDVTGAWFGTTSDDRNQDRRVVALSMAAAIAESEGD